MPPLPPAPNALKIKISGTTQGRPIVHIQHAQYSGGTPSVGDLTTIAGVVRSAWNANFASQMHALTTYNLFEVTDLASAVGNVGQNTTAVTGGGGTGTGVSVGQAMVVSWHTALHFRGGHCRTYLALRATTDIQNGNSLTPSAVTALTTAAAGYLAATTLQTSGALTWSLAMLSYRHNNAPRPTPLTFVVTSGVVHNRLDTQRRRLGKEF